MSRARAIVELDDCSDLEVGDTVNLLTEEDMRAFVLKISGSTSILKVACVVEVVESKAVSVGRFQVIDKRCVGMCDE